MFSLRRPLAMGVAVASVGVFAGLSIAPSSASASTGASASASGSTSSTTVAPKGASLSTLQQKGEAAIDKRLASITKMQGVVSAATNMSADHKATLTALLSTDQTGLAALRVKIAGDTDRSTLKTDLTAIVDDYRIYLVVDPKVHLTRAADAVTAAAGKEGNEATKLDGVVAKLNSAGKDTTAIQALLTTAHTQSQAAVSAVAGQADAVLAVDATGYPGNASTVTTVKAADTTGAADAKAARQALKSARADIKTLSGK